MDGLLLAAGAFVQRALSPALIYGVWRPAGLASNILPWGPFINRNDFAAWLVMAIPLTLGYVLMRIASQPATGDPRVDVNSIVDPRLILLLASACVMTGGILASLSRSGVISLAIALGVLMLMARPRLGRTRLTLLAAAVGVLLLAAGTYVNLPALVTRMNEAWPSGLGGRLAVWRETWPMVRDFAATGVGVGAYERAMLVYQQGNRLLFFNHAHNEFLQLVAEGGVLMGIGTTAVLASVAKTAVSNLRAIDRRYSGCAPARRAGCSESPVSRSGTRRCECRQTPSSSRSSPPSPCIHRLPFGTRGQAAAPSRSRSVKHKGHQGRKRKPCVLEERGGLLERRAAQARVARSRTRRAGGCLSSATMKSR